MTYGFTYIDTFSGVRNTETGDARFWCDMWDAERSGEIQILTVDATTDHWETSFEVYHKEG